VAANIAGRLPPYRKEGYRGWLLSQSSDLTVRRYHLTYCYWCLPHPLVYCPYKNTSIQSLTLLLQHSLSTSKVLSFHCYSHLPHISQFSQHSSLITSIIVPFFSFPKLNFGPGFASVLQSPGGTDARLRHTFSLQQRLYQ
jgi:hypothetical protein